MKYYIYVKTHTKPEADPRFVAESGPLIDHTGEMKKFSSIRHAKEYLFLIGVTKTISAQSFTFDENVEMYMDELSHPIYKIRKISYK